MLVQHPGGDEVMLEEAGECQSTRDYTLGQGDRVADIFI